MLKHDELWAAVTIYIKGVLCKKDSGEEFLEGLQMPKKFKTRYTIQIS